MTTIPIELIILTICLIAILASYAVIIFFRNKNIKSTINQFFSQTNGLPFTTFTNVRLKHWDKTGLKHYFSVNNFCDLYLFDTFILLNRRQHTVFKIRFYPIIISPTTDKKIIYKTFDTFNPDKINFSNSSVKFTLTDHSNKNVKIEITLTGLTTDQTSKLEKIKNWC